MNREKLIKFGVLLVLSGLLALFIAAGCGGGGGDGAGSTTEAGGAKEGTQAGSETGSSTEEQTTSGSESVGGGNGGEASKPTGSDAVLIKEADTICEREGKQYRQEVVKLLGQKIKSQEEEERKLEEIVEETSVPRLEAEIEELGKLSGSPGGEEAVGEMIEKLEAVVAGAEAEPLPFAAAKIPAVLEAEKTGQELGFSKCGPLG